MPDITKTWSNTNSLLHVAAQDGNAQFADLLLAYGADANIAGDQNKTPLHFAVQENHLNTVRSLLKANANPNIKDDSQQTAWSILMDKISNQGAGAQPNFKDTFKAFFDNAGLPTELYQRQQASQYLLQHFDMQMLTFPQIRTREVGTYTRRRVRQQPFHTT